MPSYGKGRFFKLLLFEDLQFLKRWELTREYLQGNSALVIEAFVGNPFFMVGKNILKKSPDFLLQTKKRLTAESTTYWERHKTIYW